MSKQGKAEHIPLSVVDPDDHDDVEMGGSPSIIRFQTSKHDLSKQIMITANIYNAYLISKYKPSEQRHWKSSGPFLRFYMSILPYFIAVVQWLAVIVLCWGRLASADTDIGEFGLYPTENWFHKLLMWPFFFIAIAYTFSKHLEYEVDVWALKHDGIVAMDLSKPNKKCKLNIEIVLLKHATEGALNQWGGLVFYAILAACSNFTQLGDTIELIFNILGYIFVFELDEYAYLLVKDIFIFSFNDKSSSEDPNTPFYGKAVFTVDGTRQAPLRLLTVFLASIGIEGIFMHSWLIFCIGSGLATLVEIIKGFVGGHQFYLCVKKKE